MPYGAQNMSGFRIDVAACPVAFDVEDRNDVCIKGLRRVRHRRGRRFGNVTFGDWCIRYRETVVILMPTLAVGSTRLRFERSGTVDSPDVATTMKSCIGAI